MKHFLQFTAEGQVRLHCASGTPFLARFRIARAFRAFAEGIDPHDHAPGFYRFDVDGEGNAMIGGRA